MEASALTTASRRGLLVRKSPLLRLQGDERLVALVRDGNPGAFEAIIDRYTGRLLGFCRQMLGSTEDAEDVLQEVFVNAYKAMLGDTREINLRPWLYRIARNRCLNHLRKPTADAQESMDMVPTVDAASTHERVHNREEFRQLLADVKKLPETQRSALLLREMDAMSYEDIAVAMDTTVPSVKSLLVRARISLAEASQARMLTCGEVRLERADAAEGLRKVSGPVRRHVRECDECGEFRKQVRVDAKVLAALSPIGPLIAFKSLIASKLGIGSGGAAGATATASGAVGGAGALGAGGAAAGGMGAASGLGGAVGGIVGAKVAAGVVTAAVLTAGAVEVEQRVLSEPPAAGAPATHKRHIEGKPQGAAVIAPATPAPVLAPPIEPAPAAVPEPAPAPDPAPAAAEPSIEPVPTPVPEVDPVPDAEVVPVPVPADPEAAPSNEGSAPADPAGPSAETSTEPGLLPAPAPEEPAAPPAASSPPSGSGGVQQGDGISSR